MPYVGEMYTGTSNNKN